MDTQAADVANFLIKEAPLSAYYIPNFISEAEEQELLSKVYDAPKPKWTTLSNRRLQNWGGLPHPKGMIPDKIPEWLNKYLLKLTEMKLFENNQPNHVLINEYKPGQGIMPHLDGPIFFPTITTISLGSNTLLDFYKPRNDAQDNTESDDFSNDQSASSSDSRYVGSMYLERRSLVCFKDDMYHTYLHGIEEREDDMLDCNSVWNKNYLSKEYPNTVERDTRVSLTIRYFPKVLKSKLRLGIR